ncbi:hypothetical protein BV20DRAFT_966187 [Pilatotrama ljubarskyi]|nr:hypothetical protein BV20DRAFT_966187 [Pilatotrama ljubarskyi]
MRQFRSSLIRACTQTARPGIAGIASIASALRRGDADTHRDPEAVSVVTDPIKSEVLFVIKWNRERCQFTHLRTDLTVEC